MKTLVIGSTNIDISVHVSAFPKVGETLIGRDLTYKYGGKGANQACACAKLGTETIFLTCVGNDAKGHEVVDHMASCGIDVSHVKVSDAQPTGTALICIDDDGHNKIVVVQGANLDCSSDYLLENEASFRECDSILLQLEIPYEAVETAIRLGNKYGKKVVLNPAPAGTSLSPDCLQMIDYLTPNETEAAVLAGIDSADPAEAAEKLLDMGIKNVLITLGEKGAVLFRKGADPVQVPAFPVKATDTVAAGDCFNGAFLCALGRGMSEKDAVRFACAASAIAVTREGAQESIPSLEEVNAFLDARGREE